jgi:hypothetical protein
MATSKGLKGLLVLVALAAVLFLCFGGWSWLRGVSGFLPPVRAEANIPATPASSVVSIGTHACADGTLYGIRVDGTAYWLVAGQMVTVACPDDLMYFGQEPQADARGGLYVSGKEHLWYLFKGRATQVREVPLGKIDGNDHAVTPQTVTWSVLRKYGTSAYDAGLDAGKEAGRSEAGAVSE